MCKKTHFLLQYLRNELILSAGSHSISSELFYTVTDSVIFPIDVFFRCEMSDHVESVSSDLEGLKDLLAGSNYFDPNLLLGVHFYWFLNAL